MWFHLLPSVEQLSKLSTYGGNDSIVAFARNHGVNIVIHQLNEPRWVIYGGDYSKNGQARELHISYHNGEHYSSVRCINDNTTEPAWIKHNEKTSAVTAVSINLYIDLAKPKSRAPDCNNYKLPWLEPAIQSKTSTWTVVNVKKR